MLLQTRIDSIQQKLAVYDDPANPSHWQAVLAGVVDVCCLYASYIKLFADTQSPQKHQIYYLKRSRAWISYADQAIDASRIMGRYSRLTETERFHIANQLRNMHGASFIASAIQHGHMDIHNINY